MKRSAILSFAVLSLFMVPNVVWGYSIEKLGNLGSSKDFVVGPGKVELEIERGQTAVSSITVTNRTGNTTTFEIGVEDFKGSSDIESPVTILDGERGPYSLKDYLIFEEKFFELKNGERATIPIRVKIPSDAEPGGKYGTVLISALPQTNKTEGGGILGNNALVTRIGTLFFVKVPGPTVSKGELKDFSVAGGSWLESGPVTFRLLYENTGSVYLNPFGEITIKNIAGTVVEKLKLDPWFALPDSVRLRQVDWKRELLLGKYTATAQINRGYGDEVDTKTITFWVVPLKVLGGGLLVIFLIVGAVRWLFSNFKIARK